MLNPAAKAVVDRDLPGLFAKLPPTVMKPEPPPPADILTIRVMASEFGAIPSSALEKLDKDLASVPLTREAAVARCARYDNSPPVLPKDLSHPAMLVFSKSNGFRDDPSVNAAKAALNAIATREHWSVFSTDNAAVFNTADLTGFDVVVWNNVSGDVSVVFADELGWKATGQSTSWSFALSAAKPRDTEAESATLKAKTSVSDSNRESTWCKAPQMQI